MSTIQARCAVCGEQELTSGQVYLKVCTHAPLSYYGFVCPCCHDRVEKPADEVIVSLLIKAGVTAEVWEIPAEALEPKSGNPISYDDILDFAIKLEESQSPTIYKELIPSK